VKRVKPATEGEGSRTRYKEIKETLTGSEGLRLSHTNSGPSGH